jgi:hypothetical protein
MTAPTDSLLREIAWKHYTMSTSGSSASRSGLTTNVDIWRAI